MRTAIVVLALTLLSSNTANAFAAAPGFTASVYANGVASGTTISGTAFIGSTLYAVDPVDNGLYSASVGVSPVTLTRIATIAGAPTGIAALGGALYVTRASGEDVVRVDPTTLITTVVAAAPAIACPAGIAADPVGDLYVSSCSWIYRIQDPAAAPVVTPYAQLQVDGVPMYGITFGPDGTIYAAVPSTGLIWRVQGPAQAAGLPPTKGPVASVATARGIALVGQYLFVSSADGSVTKAALAQTGNVLAVTGGDPGDLASLGGDGCVYVSQGAAVVRVGDASGACDLANAGPAPPPATLFLQRVSTDKPLMAGPDQTLQATVSNVTNANGTLVTFTVTGANPTTRTVAITGDVATFPYTPTNTGTDTIVATAILNGSIVRSNAVSLTYLRAYDTTPPRITYAVSGTPGANFGCPRSDIGQIGVTEYCGWYTSPPTIHWTVTALGDSGLDTRTSCPDYTLEGSSPLGGTPVTCTAYNGDRGASATLQVRLQATGAPPTIRAVATTSDGAPYVAGTPTELPVTVTFACASDVGAGGVQACTGPTTVGALGTTSVPGAVLDIAGTRTDTTFTVLIVDRTPPVATATLAPQPDANGMVPPGSTVTINATDAHGVAGMTTWTSGAQTAPMSTVSGPSVRVVLGTAGATSVFFYATDTSGNQSLTGRVDVRVSPTQSTTLAITSGPFIATGGSVSAKLLGADGVTPVAGRIIAFGAAGASATATTDLQGVATTMLSLAPGTYALTARFSGDSAYLPSADSAQLAVFAMTRFVVYAPNATLGATVQFYGGDWSKQIADKDARKAFADFKGYSDGTQGGIWTARSGDATKPPKSVPEYIGVILTTSASKTKDAISGDVAGVAIVRVSGGDDPKKPRPYDGKLGDRGFGTVVGRA